MFPSKIKKVKITSAFWKRYQQLIINKAIPFQWKMISDKEKPKVTSKTAAGGASEQSNALNNLKIAAGLKKGHHHGMIFQDTDVYKWLETVAYILGEYPDEKLKVLADKVVDLIGDAQDKDGYLSTRYQIDTPKLKFKQLQQSHELYSMGHYIEAGVAYYQNTGNQKALNTAIKMANCIDSNFGQTDGKLHGYDGHPEIELALSKLYECTKDKKYLYLANYFVNIRGENPHFFSDQNSYNDIKYDPFPEMRNASENYFFDKKPIYEQKMVQGHAVRVLYYLIGAEHVANLTGNYELSRAVSHLWNDIVKKQMYITGNVGQTAVGEAFTCDYDLPNRTDYGETCASVAMAMLAKQMEFSHLSGQYGDVIEREIYNGALAGIALDGEHYFYANPLEVDENSKYNPSSSHLSMKRLSWFSCACCPSNITRLLASLSQYIYTYSSKNNYLLLDQLISNVAILNNDIEIRVKSGFPWKGNVEINVKVPANEKLNLKVRIPKWSKKTLVKIDGQLKKIHPENGILDFQIVHNVKINLNYDMSIEKIHANPLVMADQGKVAFKKGPIIFCAEQIDNSGNHTNYLVPKEINIEAKYEENLLHGVETLEIKNAVYQEEKDLYINQENRINRKLAKLKLIPYYAWANREPGSMNVWFNQSEEKHND